MTLSSAFLRQAQEIVRTRLGLEFSGQRLRDLERGLERALADPPSQRAEDYLTRLAAAPAGSPELRHLARHLTVGETYFFRDQPVFAALERHVLPALIAARRAVGVPSLRLWSAGCATGEEPYSLAILLDRLLPDRRGWSITILATDINPAAIDGAQRARYRAWSFRQAPPWLQDRYFRRTRSGDFELVPAIRQMVTFAPLNLAEDVYPRVLTNTSAMDIVLCRNVLLYFTAAAQRSTVARLRRALTPGGWLVVSAAEGSPDLFEPFVPVRFPGVVLYRKSAERTGMSAPVPGDEPPPHPRAPADLPLRTVATAPPAASSPPAPLIGMGPSAPTTDAPPPDAPAALRRARELADEGALEDARRVCEQALASDRLQPEAYLLLAAVCQEQGAIDDARRALQRAIYLDPDCAPAHFLLGSILLREGERRRALRCMETVVHLVGGLPQESVLPGAAGLTAGRILETAEAYLEMSRASA